MISVEECIVDLIAERRGTLDEHDDLLTAALDTDDTMNQTVRDQLVTFVFAGHETTALALTYTIWLLTARPDIQTRLATELDAVCDD